MRFLPPRAAALVIVLFACGGGPVDAPQTFTLETEADTYCRFRAPVDSDSGDAGSSGAACASTKLAEWVGETCSRACLDVGALPELKSCQPVRVDKDRHLLDCVFVDHVGSTKCSK